MRFLLCRVFAVFIVPFFASHFMQPEHSKTERTFRNYRNIRGTFPLLFLCRPPPTVMSVRTLQFSGCWRALAKGTAWAFFIAQFFFFFRRRGRPVWQVAQSAPRRCCGVVVLLVCAAGKVAFPGTRASDVVCSVDRGSSLWLADARITIWLPPAPRSH